MSKELVGKQIRYRYCKGPDDGPMDRTGVIKVYGRAYITTIYDVTGKDDYCGFNDFVLADGSAPPPVVLKQAPIADPAVETHTDSIHTPNVPEEEESPFSTLEPRSIVEYRESEMEGAAHFGYFVKYEKHYRQVTIETIPAYSGTKRKIALKDHLVRPY